MCVHACACVHACEYVHVRECMHICVHVLVHVCECVNAHVCVCMCMRRENNITVQTVDDERCQRAWRSSLDDCGF